MTPNKYIATEYQLYTVENGKKSLVEKTRPDQPFVFISGFGIALEALEARIAGLEAGSSFDVTLTKDEAFGDYHPERVVELDKELFCINGHFDMEHVHKGAVIPLQNEDGTRFMGTVTDITDTVVVTDLNSPLAGKTINFVGKVLENRDATNAEIEHIVNMISGESGCGGCGGCGEGGCGEGSCKSHGHDSGCESHHHSHGQCGHHHDNGGCHHHCKH